MTLPADRVVHIAVSHQRRSRDRASRRRTWRNKLLGLVLNLRRVPEVASVMRL
jgi:hypothetical protein